VVDRKIINLKRDCVELCKDHSSCTHSSYFAKQRTCLLFEKCEVMETFPHAISSSRDCNVDPEEKLLVTMIAEGNSSLLLVSLVSLTEPNTTCPLPSFQHPSKVKYFDYIEKLNASIACLEDIPDCFTFDGLSWKRLLTQRKPGCGYDSFAKVPQGLLNHKGKCTAGPSDEWGMEEFISEIYDGQAWVELEFEDANLTLPIKYNYYVGWSPKIQQVFLNANNNYNNTNLYWTLDYENRKWITIPEIEGFNDVDDEGVDWSNFPSRVLSRGEGEGYLGFYRHKEQVYRAKEWNGTWTPLDGVFLPEKYDDWPSTVHLVPESFSIGCLDD